MAMPRAEVPETPATRFIATRPPEFVVTMRCHVKDAKSNFSARALLLRKLADFSVVVTCLLHSKGLFMRSRQTLPATLSLLDWKSKADYEDQLMNLLRFVVTDQLQW